MLSTPPKKKGCNVPWEGTNLKKTLIIFQASKNFGKYLSFHRVIRNFSSKKKAAPNQDTIAVPPVRYGLSICIGQTANTPNMARAEPAAIRYFGLRANAYRIAGIAAGPTSVAGKGNHDQSEWDTPAGKLANIRYPPKTNMTMVNPPIWRCISYWKWGFGKCHVSFQGCNISWKILLSFWNGTFLHFHWG